MNNYEKAVEYATQKHAGQYRKGPKVIPYIQHPLNVAQILERTGQKDEVIIAGVLHDVVEDTPTTIEDITKTFGAKVSKLVAGVTEKGEGMSWDERLNKYLDRVKKSSKDTKNICVADKIDNMNSMIACLESGYNIFDKMYVGKNKQINKFNLIIKEIGNDVTPQLKELYIQTLNKLTMLVKK